jgi:hypothetical protein
LPGALLAWEGAPGDGCSSSLTHAFGAGHFSLDLRRPPRGFIRHRDKHRTAAPERLARCRPGPESMALEIESSRAGSAAAAPRHGQRGGKGAKRQSGERAKRRPRQGQACRLNSSRASPARGSGSFGSWPLSGRW